MRIIFCGTPEFAVPCLDALVAAGHAVELVLAQPDRPSGRGMKLSAPPVKLAAQRQGISVEQPSKIKTNEELRAQLTAIAPDAIVVVAYGRILPAWMLQLPRYGCVNVHASLLPKYRGAAPIQWAMANGDRVTGVTTMQMDEGLDTGAMLLQREVAIRDEWRAPELSAELSRVGAELLVETLVAMERGELQSVPQQANSAAYAPLLTRDDGRVDWNLPAVTIRNRWRAFTPWPGAHTLLDGGPMQLKKLQISELQLEPATPATQHVDHGRWFVCCGDGAWLELLEVQLAGRRALPAAEFLRGYSVDAALPLGG